MKKILFLVFVCVMIEGCNTCKDDPNLNAEELSWMPYKGGETLIFQNLSGGYDTIIVGQKMFYTWAIGDEEEEDHSHCSYYTQELDITIGPYHYSISHKNMDVTYSKPMWPGGTQAGDIPCLDNQNISTSPFQSSIVLNGRTFNNVYNPGNLYYSKQDGIVAFKGTINDTLLYVKIN